MSQKIYFLLSNRLMGQGANVFNFILLLCNQQEITCILETTSHPWHMPCTLLQIITIKWPVPYLPSQHLPAVINSSPGLLGPLMALQQQDGL